MSASIGQPEQLGPSYLLTSRNADPVLLFFLCVVQHFPLHFNRRVAVSASFFCISFSECYMYRALLQSLPITVRLMIILLLQRLLASGTLGRKSQEIAPSFLGHLSFQQFPLPHLFRMVRVKNSSFHIIPLLSLSPSLLAQNRASKSSWMNWGSTKFSE